MSSVYSTIRRKRVGIFESPTGTGKTLSLICSAMTWLREYQEFGSDEEDVIEAAGGAENVPVDTTGAPRAWCVSFDRERVLRERAARLARGTEVRSELAQRLAALRVADSSARISGGGVGMGGVRYPGGARASTAAVAAAAALKRRREAAMDGIAKGTTDDDDDGLIVAEYHSDSDASVSEGVDGASRVGAGFSVGGANGTGGGMGGMAVWSSASARAMSVADSIRAELQGGGGGGSASGGALDGGADDEAFRAAFTPKIFYVSRTHSQIAQFVGEIARTTFGRDARVVSLGARKALCVHPAVRALGSDSRINERCNELADAARGARSKSSAAAVGGNAPAAGESAGGVWAGGDAGEVATAAKPGCPYLDAAAGDTFRDALLSRVRDVEESGALGAELGACAYYGARKAANFAEVVTLPYSMLLSAATRDALGIDLRGAVVIVDEAHNLIDAINATHASSVTSAQLASAHDAVCAYVDRYRARLKGSNAAHCDALADILFKLLEFLEQGGAARTSQAVEAARATRARVAANRDAHAASVAAAVASAAPSPRRLPGGSAAALVRPAVFAGPGATTNAPPPPSPKRNAVVAAHGLSLATFFAASAPVSRSATPSRLFATRPAPLPAPSVGISTAAATAAMLPPAPPPTIPQSLPPPLAALAPAQYPQRLASEVLSVPEFFAAAGLASTNIFKIRKYVDAVSLLRKLRGFAEAAARATPCAEVTIHKNFKRAGVSARTSTANEDDAAVGPGATTPAQPSYMAGIAAIQAAYSLLCALMGAEGDGRLVVTRSTAASGTGGGSGGGAGSAGGVSAYKFVLLNPAVPFRDVGRSARAVILAGGTLAPVGDLIDQLLRGTVPRTRIDTFSCGHMIPRDSLAAFTVAAGPTGERFDFRHSSRERSALVDELGRALLGSVALVPAGVVVFLSSYDYMKTLLEAWARAPNDAAHSVVGTPAAPAPGSVLAQLSRRKRVFTEPRAAADVDAVWTDYAAAARAATGGGAVLFAVMGGKMSEGINFSDDLARGVIVVGLPFGNPADPELRERMAYLDRRSGTTPATAGRDYYESLCMRTVNQSIGRSIRHVGDHAVIILLDARYATPRIRGKLPAWIGERVTSHDTWSTVAAGVGAFFRMRRQAGGRASSEALE